MFSRSLTVFLIAVSCASGVDAQGAVTIEAGLAADAMRRNAGLAMGGYEAANLAIDHVLDKVLTGDNPETSGQRLLRFGRLWFVNLPVAALIHGATHDYGHFSHLGELGVHNHTREVTMWPWPVPVAYSVEFFDSDRHFRATEETAVIAGGEEGAATLRRALMNKIYGGDSAYYGDDVLLGYAVMDFTAYALTDLGVSVNADGSLPGNIGDFEEYVIRLMEQRPRREWQSAIRDLSARLRRDAWLNLLDLGFYSAFKDVATYVMTGEKQSAPATLPLGSLKVVPGLHAALTPDGPEEGLDVRLLSPRYLTHVELRHVTTATEESLWGTGVTLRSRDGRHYRPEARIDVAQESDASPGYAVQVGVRGPVPGTRQRLVVAPLVGYKNTGYLPDLPVRSGGLFSIAVTFR